MATRIQLNQDSTLETKHKEYDTELEKIGVINLKKHVSGKIAGEFSQYKTDWLAKYYRETFGFQPDDGFFVREKTNNFGIFVLCKSCGMEFYGEWTTVNVDCSRYNIYTALYMGEYIDENKETEQIWNLWKQVKKTTKNVHEKFWKKEETIIRDIIGKKTCICCGQKLSKEPWHYSVSKPPRELTDIVPEIEATETEVEGKYLGRFGDEIKHGEVSEIYKRLISIRDRKEREFAEEKAKEYIASCNLPVSTNVEKAKIEDIKHNPDKLKEYILSLIQLEMNIYSLEKRLPKLYRQKYAYDRDSEFVLHSPVLEEFSKKQELIRSLSREIARAEDEYEKYIELQTQYEEGRFPKACPTKPLEPIYKTAGFFNKKKIEGENQKIKENYEIELKHFEEQILAYEDNKKIWLMDAKKKVQDAKQILDELKERVEGMKLSSSVENIQLDTSLPEVQYKELMDQDIENLESTLKKLYQCRNELYSLDIVFGKYKNPVALATFYEYLMAGRCSALEGADGAYNIYEQEIRADRIIDQLGVIITKLEDIKSNQYMIYNELKTVNQHLEHLNKTAESIDKSVDNLKESAAVIAYNTAAAAYYSKMNTELTNALGFMVVLNG